MLILFNKSTVHVATVQLWKEISNSDGQQIHQSKQSPLILTQHRHTNIYDRCQPGSGLRQADTCGSVRPVNAIPTRYIAYTRKLSIEINLSKPRCNFT